MKVHEAFDRAGAEGRAALVGYLPAGFPTVDRSVDEPADDEVVPPARDDGEP